MRLPNVMRTPEEERELWPCVCGSSDVWPLYLEGPTVRTNYVMQYVTEGREVCELGETCYELGAGEGILIGPNVVSFCRSLAEGPLRYVWLEFKGSEAERYLRELGFRPEDPLFRGEQPERFQRIVDEMRRSGSYAVRDQLSRTALLYEWLSLAARKEDPPCSRHRPEDRHYTRGAVEFIRGHYTVPIQVSEIADYLQINRCHLYYLFQKAFGMSPQEFLKNYRLARGRELLAQTDLSLEGVAYSCGYRSPLVFARAYKKKTGMTPQHYRAHSPFVARGREKRQGGRNDADLLS